MVNHKIDIFNYIKSDVENKIYNNPVKLIIKANSFEKAKASLTIKKNQTTISFQNVKFNSEISINVDEGIEDEISIGFHNCFIDSFSDFALESKNMVLFFGNCFVQNLRVQSRNLKSIKLNNCFGSYFIEGIKNVNVSYSEENIFLKDWVNQIKTEKQLQNLLNYKTIFHITDAESINFYGHEIEEKRKQQLIKERLLKSDGKYEGFGLDRQAYKKNKLKRILTLKEKELLNINIDLSYNIGFNHIKTQVSNLLLEAISLGGKAKGEVRIEDCKINNIYIRDFSPKSDFSLYNIKPLVGKGNFEVHNSNLDNTWFNAVSLKNYFVVFHKSSFINTKFSSTVFPSVKELKSSISSVKNIHYPNEIKDKKSFYRDMYELFLELKQAFDKRGNSFESQKMKSVAHEFLYKIEDWKVSKSDFWNNKIILGLNRLSNFHGISIRNAFFLALIIILVFHSLNVLSFESVEFGYKDWGEFKDIVSNEIRYLFSIANPAHKLSSLAPVNEITGWTYMTSFFSRIFIGFAFYQFVAAFRRFGK
ncbi:hypothetical protein [Flavivirga spongiicola]|uniref:Pentapeptide repeat-containing protein n=1 Tax=Flavivirga spongiicola TaxID=421621 RepID=A0ABU7XTV3_9FLAO|nr:hypothetical protein [Flavivirga sp. MEBiC05379]MDO5979208.1 hypothetical protein [Flavivirga sp. MEBiC05379]